MVVNGLDHPKTPYTIEMAVKLADQAGATHMAVVEEVEPSRIGTKIEDCASTQKSDKAQRRIETEVKARIASILGNLT